MKYTVTGHINEPEGQTPFKATYSGADKAEARWAARRDQAPGKALGKIEKAPPNPEREAVEIAAPNTQAEAIEIGQVFCHPRSEPRSADEAAEYDRLVASVHIDSIQEQS